MNPSLPIRKGQRVVIRPEWRNPGEDQFDWIAVEDERQGQVRIAPLGTGLGVPFSETVFTGMLETQVQPLPA